MTDFLDTNILLYAISTRRNDAAKRRIAEDILDGMDWAISIQVLQEFTYQSTRANRPDPLSIAQVEALVKHWLQFHVQDMTAEILLAALILSERFKFSYWDSAILAAAISTGCSRLLTEDLTHGQVVEGVTVVNPFRRS